MAKQPHTSIRYTPEAKRLLEILAKKLGVSQTAVVKLAIREFAEKRDVHDQNFSNSLPSA
jgi:predicted transcriptional regulator